MPLTSTTPGYRAISAAVAVRSAAAYRAVAVAAGAHEPTAAGDDAAVDATISAGASVVYAYSIS